MLKDSLRVQRAVYWTTIAIDAARGDESNSIYVLGYIKSGTNWLCNLLSTCLGIQILEAWKRPWPHLGPCIFHMHRFVPLTPVRRRTVYMIRDGRDTTVSAYFYVARKDNPIRRGFQVATGEVIEAARARELMPAFIRYMAKNRVATTDYRTHLETYQRHRDQYALVRYEDLLEDAGREVARVIDAVRQEVPAPEVIAAAVDTHSFSRVTNRRQGEEQSDAFLRKGIAGDWRNYFTVEAAEAYREYAGDLLINFGYEKDDDWVAAVADSTSVQAD